jgi:sugar phosphate isomerase/epimerase
MDPRRISRRQFLRTGAATAAGLAVLPALLRADDKKRDPFGGFTLGVQSYSFRNFDLEPALKRTQALGLHSIEFFQKHVPLDSSPDQIKAILRLCKDYDITPVAYGVQAFGKDHGANKKLFDFGKELGIRTFSANPQQNNETFDSLDKLCDEYKISIGIHPHGPQGNRLHEWYSAEIIMKWVKDRNPLIGSCLDTGHLIRSAQPPFNKKLVPQDQVRVMDRRNFGMHLKDHDNQKRTDVPFGQGVLDVAAVLKALRDEDFKGYLSIEYEAHPEDPSPDMKQCVAVFEESVKKLG